MENKNYDVFKLQISLKKLQFLLRLWVHTSKTHWLNFLTMINEMSITNWLNKQEYLKINFFIHKADTSLESKNKFLYSQKINPRFTFLSERKTLVNKTLFFLVFFFRKRNELFSFITYKNKLFNFVIHKNKLALFFFLFFLLKRNPFSVYSHLKE